MLFLDSFVFIRLKEKKRIIFKKNVFTVVLRETHNTQMEDL